MQRAAILAWLLILAGSSVPGQEQAAGEPHSRMAGSEEERDEQINKQLGAKGALVNWFGGEEVKLEAMIESLGEKWGIDVSGRWESLEPSGFKRDAQISMSLYDATLVDALRTVFWLAQPDNPDVTWWASRGKLEIFQSNARTDREENAITLQRAKELEEKLREQWHGNEQANKGLPKILLNALSTSSTIGIAVDWNSLRAAGMTERDVEIQGKGKEIREILDEVVGKILLKDGKAAWRTDGGVVRISTEDVICGNAAIRRVLRDSVIKELTSSRQPLEKVLRFLEENVFSERGITMHVDWTELERVGLGKETEIECSLRELRLDQLLRAILWHAGPTNNVDSDDGSDRVRARCPDGRSDGGD